MHPHPEIHVNPRDRVMAYGYQLIEIHLDLHDELMTLRGDVDAFLDGSSNDLRSTHTLQGHCLAFCSALTTHHTDEDRGIFPEVAAEFPQLRPVLAQLTQDHSSMAGILRAVEHVINGIGPEPDDATARRVRGELAGLTALMESHFRHEEKRLVDALNALYPATH